MSERYPGGIISKNAPTVTGGTTGSGSAPGVWTLDQQAVYAKAGTWPLAGNYIEDVFSTYLYTGNSSTQTITNGIDLAGKGGLVWLKSRSLAEANQLFDTNRGVENRLFTNTTGAQNTGTGTLTNFYADGFAIGSNNISNTSGSTNVSWTFRKQPKFFDVVTYTGDGTANRNVAHSLGSAPGFVIIKKTNNTSNWNVAARLNSGDASFMMLNRTVAQTSTSSSWFNSTTFKVGTSDWPSSTGSPDFFGYDTNGTGDTYVAYLFAHNAGGFGLTGTDNVISCGSYTGNGSTSGPVVTLGYEPQWLLVKRSDSIGDWLLFDVMRGLLASGDNNRILFPNLSSAEITGNTGYGIAVTSTGFRLITDNGIVNSSGSPYIYIAIRRGPMKTPTSGTSVFGVNTRTGVTNSTTTITSPLSPSGDSFWLFDRGTSDGSGACGVFTRLIGGNALITQNTNAETGSVMNWGDSQSTMKFTSTWDGASQNYVQYFFSRAPGFFDEVCYTGNLTQRNINHNLTVIPELFIVKSRSAAAAWYVSYYKSSTQDMEGNLNTTAALTTRDWSSGNFGAASTATTFSVGPYTDINNSGGTYVAYLFASCPGVSKVGSYTGTGATQTISCGFTGGARFVLIKRTDSTGDWYVWDTARGMVSGTDPSLMLNSTAAEVNANSIYTTTGGFQIVSTAAGINASGGTYIYLAIA